MTVRNKLFTVLSSFLMVFAVGSFAFGQETPATTQQDKNVNQEAPKEGKKGFGHRRGKDGSMRGKHGGGKGFGHRGGGMHRGFAQLNLSEEQKLQMKNLHEGFKAGHEASFKEMQTLFQQKRDKTLTADGQARMQELRKQLKADRQQLRGSIQNILTAEQKTQLETMKQERRQKMEERRKLRQQGAPKPAAPETKETSL